MTDLDALKLATEASLRTLSLAVVIAESTCNRGDERMRQFIKSQRDWYNAALDMVNADNLISEVVDE